MCISYFIFDLIFISSFFITKNIPELLYISNFNIRTLLICIIHCYSSGFVEKPMFKNTLHRSKLFMLLFANNITLVICGILIDIPFMFYVHIAFAVLETILSILILKSLKSDISAQKLN